MSAYKIMSERKMKMKMVEMRKKWATMCLHLSLIAPSSVSNSVRDGGTFGGPQFFTFSSAKSHENCLHFKVAPVINDKKHPKHLVVTGALHVIQ